MTNIEFHPYCILFPSCSEEELKTLAEDIFENGLLEPIVLLDEKILDGRNRYLACLQSNITLKTVEFTGDDPLAFVLSKNLYRRHLNESQRAMIASEIANLRQGEQIKSKCLNLGICNSLQNKELEQVEHSASKKMANISQTEAAKMLNVSRDSIQKAFKLRKKDSPVIIQQIKESKKTIHSALAETKGKNQKKKIIAKEQESSTEAEQKLWKDTDAVCIVCGKVSGNLLMIDFDQQGKAFSDFINKIPHELFDRLVIEKSQSGGFRDCPKRTISWKKYHSCKGL